MRSVRIGTETGYWGDKLDASHVLLERGNIKYLASDMLAELTLAIHQRIKARDPKQGYVSQIEPFFEQDLKLAMEKGVKIISNGGAANPEAGADVVANIAKKQGIQKLKDYKVGGLQGPVTYTAGDNRLTKFNRIYQIVNGKITNPSPWTEASLIKYEEYSWFGK